MIPLIDDYLQGFLVDRLKWLKTHPAVIDMIFSTGRRETLSKLREFITSTKVKVIIGYPKEQTQLPCYVITLAPENEEPVGLGDDYETFSDCDFTDGTNATVSEVVKSMSKFLSSAYMNSNYRIECWSDNGDLTSYMYTILKWCMWSSRRDMTSIGWVNIKMSGMDLEPVPDYMPVFIYRRTAQISLMYENLYYEKTKELEKYAKVITEPDKYHKDSDDNIVDDDGNVIIPSSMTWILSSHYHDSVTGKEYASKKYRIGQE